jgi:hypothetical protein
MKKKKKRRRKKKKKKKKCKIIHIVGTFCTVHIPRNFYKFLTVFWDYPKSINSLLQVIWLSIIHVVIAG